MSPLALSALVAVLAGFAGTGAAADRFLSERAESVPGDPKLHVVHGELLAVLLVDVGEGDQGVISITCAALRV